MENKTLAYMAVCLGCAMMDNDVTAMELPQGQPQAQAQPQITEANIVYDINTMITDSRLRDAINAFKAGNDEGVLQSLSPQNALGVAATLQEQNLANLLLAYSRIQAKGKGVTEYGLANLELNALQDNLSDCIDAALLTIGGTNLSVFLVLPLIDDISHKLPDYQVDAKEIRITKARLAMNRYRYLFSVDGWISPLFAYRYIARNINILSTGEIQETFLHERMFETYQYARILLRLALDLDGQNPIERHACLIGARNLLRHFFNNTTGELVYGFDLTIEDYLNSELIYIAGKAEKELSTGRAATIWSNFEEFGDLDDLSAEEYDEVLQEVPELANVI